jgi:opacity protein-like surface antigen
MAVVSKHAVKPTTATVVLVRLQTRIRYITLAGGVLLTALATSARADSSWYVSGSAGAYLREDQDGPTTFFRGNASGPGEQHETFDPGLTVSGAVGYKLPLHLRLEGEFTYAEFTPDHINPVGGPAPSLNGSALNRQSGGNFNRYMGSINIFWDLPVVPEDSRYSPYVGTGLGYVRTNTVETTFVNGSGSFRQTFAAADHGVALIEAGVSIALSPSWSLVPAYRYVHYFANANVFGDENAHIFKLGVRYSF